MAANNGGAPPGHRVDEWLEPVEKELVVRLSTQANLECLKNILRDTGSLIAGGCILQAIQPFSDQSKPESKINDIDIYVPVAQIPTFIQRLRDECRFFGTTRYNAIKASLYCKSFLRKNGIRKVYTFSKRNGLDSKKDSIDIMAVRNKRTPLRVVNNFDLTFCQVWYDGNHVYASHPDHIREKKGFMSAEYIPTFLAGNRFLAKRTKKYLDRGFTILPDPAAPSLQDLFKSIPEQMKITFAKTDAKSDITDEFLKHWIHSMLFFIAKTELDYGDGYIDSIYPNDNMDPKLKGYPILPLVDTKYSSEGKDIIFTKNLRNGIDIARKWKVSKFDYTYAVDVVNNTFQVKNGIDPLVKFTNTDGYDSDDYTNESIQNDIIHIYYKDSPDDLVFKEEGGVRTPNPSDALKFHRALTRIIIHALGVIKVMNINNENENDDEIINNFLYIMELLKKDINVNTTLQLARMQHYANAMKQYMTRKGVDFMGDEGQLYDIHNHPLDGAITQDSLEAYCESHMRDVDKTEVPCYWQPEPGDSPRNCKHKLRLEEVRAIVSHEFYERYNKQAPIKTGLNQIVPVYNIVFEDKRTVDTSPAHWGGATGIYGKAVCPFCLQLENREYGCAYMLHDNPTRLPDTDAPFCMEHFKTPLWDMYKKRAIALLGPGTAEDLPEAAIHLEFCIECGRPSVNHRHFNLNNPPDLMPVADSGLCTGGGRPEMFARILAIREIFRNPEIDVPAEERAAAATAADAAVRDPAYIARGQAIFEKSEAERKWNVNVPGRKDYNNNAYRNQNEANEKENANLAEAAVGGNNNQHGGRDRRRTYKKRKGSKFTRRRRD